MTASTLNKLLFSALLATGMTIGASGVAVADRVGQDQQDGYEHTEQDRTTDAMDEEEHEGFDHDQDDQTMDADDQDDHDRHTDDDEW